MVAERTPHATREHHEMFPSLIIYRRFKEEKESYNKIVYNAESET